MKVLVFIEQRDGKIKSSAHEALTAGVDEYAPLAA